MSEEEEGTCRGEERSEAEDAEEDGAAGLSGTTKLNESYEGGRSSAALEAGLRAVEEPEGGEANDNEFGAEAEEDKEAGGVR